MQYSVQYKVQKWDPVYWECTGAGESWSRENWNWCCFPGNKETCIIHRLSKVCTKYYHITPHKTFKTTQAPELTQSTGEERETSNRRHHRPATGTRVKKAMLQAGKQEHEEAKAGCLQTRATARPTSADTATQCAYVHRELKRQLWPQRSW